MKSLKEKLVYEGLIRRQAGVGIRSKIEAWLKEYGVDVYFINDDMTIDVNGYVSLGKYTGKQLPDYIQFGEVTVGFDFSGCPKLESLRGVPERVGGYFDCGDCPKLESLEGAPQYVGGSFHCNNCPKLESLRGAPQKVVGVFNCGHCAKLESLRGAPREVGTGFHCCECPKLESLEGAPQKVGEYFICYNCGVQFTEEDVKKVCKVGGNIRV